LVAGVLLWFVGLASGLILNRVSTEKKLSSLQEALQAQQTQLIQTEQSLRRETRWNMYFRPAAAELRGNVLGLAGRIRKFVAEWRSGARELVVQYELQSKRAESEVERQDVRDAYLHEMELLISRKREQYESQFKEEAAVARRALLNRLPRIEGQSGVDFESPADAMEIEKVAAELDRLARLL
jgi:hypothetical protein